MALERKDLPTALRVVKELEEIRENMVPSDSLAVITGLKRSLIEQMKLGTSVSDLVRDLGTNSAFAPISDLVGCVGPNSALSESIPEPLHEMFGSRLGLPSATVDEFRRLHELAGADQTWGSLMKAAETLSAEGTIGGEIMRMKRLSELLVGHVNEASYTAWSQHLKALTLPAAAFLAHDWPSPTGFLTEVARPGSGAAVSWLARRDGEPAILTTSIVAEPVEKVPKLTINVEGEPVCAICGDPMLRMDVPGHVVGPKRGIARVRIFPACPRCFAREQRQPGYLVSTLQKMNRPRLYVIRGDGDGDGIRRGKLRFVPAQEGSDRDDVES